MHLGRVRTLALWLGVAIVAVALLSSPLTGEAGAQARSIDHADLVPQVPERGYPIVIVDNVIRGRGPYTNVYATDQVGDLIVSGGDFRRIERQDGNIISAGGFAAWGVDDKELVCPGAFTFDDTIFSIDKAPWPRHVYVGGKFRTITDSTGVTHGRQKMALLDLNDCTVDPIFNVVSANGSVQSIEFEHDRLFVAGGFTSIAGNDTMLVAELDPFTGRAVQSFQATGSMNAIYGNSRALEMNDAGDRLVLLARYVTQMTMGGQTINNSASFVFDISNPAAPMLTPHSWPFFTGWGQMHGGGISDDGLRIAASYHLGVHYIDVVEAPTTTKWTHWNGDGTFDAAVSNNAVYASGHFCRTQPGPGPTDNMAPVGGHTRCSLGGSTYRTQFVAYSLVDGTPLTWNPGNTAQVGGKAITIVPRGLLFGFDGDRVATIRTGQVAFLDFGPEADPNPDLVATCLATQQDRDVLISWSIDHIADVTIRNTNGWVADATGGQHLVERATIDDGLMVRYRYANRTIDLPCATEGTMPPPATCTATQIGEDVRVDWVVPFVAQVSIRDVDGWVADSTDGSHIEVDSLNDRGFLVRFFQDGQVNDVPCDVEGTPPPPPSCTATQTGTDVRIDWVAPFVETVAIRDVNGWVADSTNGSHLALDASIEDGFMIRVRTDGNVDVVCEVAGTPPLPPPPPPAPVCTVTQVDADVLVEWANVDARTVVVRQDDRWVTTVDDGTEVLIPERAAAGFTIRFSSNDGRIDVACN